MASCTCVLPVSVKNGDCCSSKQVQSNKALKKVELICRIALGVFGFIMDAGVFLLTATSGALLGAGYAFYKIYKGENVKEGLARPSCAQGFFDYLSGIRCSPVLSAVITAIFIAGHMHHSSFYVGFCGVPWGFFIGFQGVIKARELAHKF